MFFVNVTSGAPTDCAVGCDVASRQMDAAAMTAVASVARIAAPLYFTCKGEAFSLAAARAGRSRAEAGKRRPTRGKTTTLRAAPVGQRERQKRRARGDDDALTAVEQICHRRRAPDGVARGVPPEIRAGPRV